MSTKTVFVTGATSGIGLGIAKKFAKQSYRMVIGGFGDDQSIKEQLFLLQEMSGRPVVYCPEDLTKPKEIEAMFQRLEKEVGSIDILVNNAGIQYVAPLEDFPTEKWDQIIGLDLSAAFHTTRLVIPKMREKKWGRIINVASAHALVASPYKSAYVAAKHGLAGLTKVAALEVAKDNITVNAICPGYVHTSLVDNQIDDTARTRGITREEVIKDVMLAPQATKKFVKIDEVAHLVDFLCCDEASSITGALLSIDGGWTSH